MQIHSTHKNSSGFTLIELVIAVAVIGILTSVAVLGYNQYKVRAYDAHSKQALRDILLQCNAFWLDHDTSQVCNHATVAEVYVASDEIVLKFPAEDLPDLPGGSQGNFCASAQHESSPNTYSIDSASLISSGSDCSGTGGSVQTASVSPAQTFATYNVTTAQEECERNTASGEFGYFAVVDSDGFNLLGSTHGDRHRKSWRVPTNREEQFLRNGVSAGQDGIMPVRCDELSQWTKYLRYHGDSCDPDPTRCVGARVDGEWVAQGKRMEWGGTYVPNETSEGVMSEGRGTNLYVNQRNLATGLAHVVFVGGEGSEFVGAGAREVLHCQPWSSEAVCKRYGRIVWNVEKDDIRENMKYNFETGLWSNAQGDKFKNGNRVE